jgi:hypothetical protein
LGRYSGQQRHVLYSIDCTDMQCFVDLRPLMLRGIFGNVNNKSVAGPSVTRIVISNILRATDSASSTGHRGCFSPSVSDFKSYS